MGRAPAVHAGAAHRAAERKHRIVASLDYALPAFWPWWQRAARFMPAKHITVFCAVAEQWMGAQVDWHNAIEALADVPADEIAEMPDAALDPGTGRPRRIIINVPPGCSKSSVWSRTLPMWWWLRRPGWAWLGVSHQLERLAYRLHADRNSIARHPAYQALAAEMGWHMRKTQATSSTTSHGGHILMAAGSGKGDGIGLHHHAQIYDDAISLDQMRSPAMVATVNNTLTEVLADRWKQARAAAWANVMQRLLPGDPTDMLQAATPGDICHIILPRAYEPERYSLPDDDPKRIAEVVDLGEPVDLLQRTFDGDRAWRGYRDKLDQAGFWVEDGRLLWRDWRTTAGEPLDPKRFGAQEEAKARDAGTWPGPQQQRPELPDGGIIERGWFTAADEGGEGWRRLPAGQPDEILVSVDTQRADQKGVGEPDWTVLLVGARFGGHLYIIEIVRARMGATVLNAIVWLLWHRHGRRQVRFIVEASNSGDTVSNRQRGLGPQVDVQKPAGSKKERLEAAAPTIRMGVVHLPARDAERPSWLGQTQAWPLRELSPADPELPSQLLPAAGAPPEGAVKCDAPHVWTRKFRDEVCGISRGSASKHDDQADALSQMIANVEPRMGHQPSRVPDIAKVPGAPQPRAASVRLW